MQHDDLPDSQVLADAAAEYLTQAGDALSQESADVLRSSNLDLNPDLQRSYPRFADTKIPCTPTLQLSTEAVRALTRHTEQEAREIITRVKHVVEQFLPPSLEVTTWATHWAAPQAQLTSPVLEQHAHRADATVAGDIDVSDHRSLHELVLALRGVLVARAIDVDNDDARYRDLREAALAEPTLRDKLPAFVRICQSLGEFWGFIRPEFKKYRDREAYLRDQFQPVLDFLSEQQQADHHESQSSGDVANEEAMNSTPHEEQATTDPIGAILADVSSRLEQFAQVAPRLSKMRTDLQDRHTIANRLGLAWSGSWIGFQASLYYTGFGTPGLKQQFNSEWGSVAGIPNYWEPKSYDDVKAYVDSQYSGVSFVDAGRELTNYQPQAVELHRSICDELSFVKGVPFFAEEAKQLGKLEDLKWGKSTRQLILERMPGTTWSRDSKAMSQGRKVPPHIQMEAEMDSALSYIHGIQQFINDARSLVRRIEIRRAIVQPLLQAASSADAAEVENREGDKTMDRRTVTPGTKVFIGHGRSSNWKDLKDFIQDRLKLPWDEFNRVPIAGFTNIQRLSEMLDDAMFAFLVLTAEDEQADGGMHARMNVVHEAGLFQGRLGFAQAIILLEEGCEQFSNIEGLGQIRFPKGDITAIFEKVRHVLEREGILKT